MSASADNLFRSVITKNVRSILKTDFNLAWLMALNNPVRRLYDEFVAFRSSSVLAMKRNGQKIILETLLNVTFPEALDGIFITTVQSNSGLVFMGLGNSSDSGVFLGMAQDQGVFMGLPSSYAYDYDFIVQIPVGIDLDIPRLRGLVIQNKLAGKRFIIKQGEQILASSWTPNPVPAL